MSTLSRIHNDYLDPDRHLWPDEDYGFNEVLSELKKHSTGRWQYSQIDCCLTGKDADLETGNMGLKLDNVTDEHALATVRAYKTVVGDNCCFNLADNATDEQLEKARTAYLDLMTEVVCGCNYPGEWTGDDWGITFEQTIKVPTVLTEDETETDAVQTAEALIAEAEKVLVPFEKEMEYLELAGSQFAGWKDERGRRMKEGRIPKCAAWNQKSLLVPRNSLINTAITGSTLWE